MAERPIIRVGDTTTHGGTVLEGFETFDVYGRLASGMGHKVRCPRCRGIYVIIEGAESHTVNGVPIAAEGMLTSCGATLIASQTNAWMEIGSIASAALAFGSAADAAGDGASYPTAKDYDQHFHLVDSATGDPLANRRYEITVDGKTFEGRTDDSGKTELVSANSAHTAKIEVFPEGE